MSLQVIEILGLCPVGSALPHGERSLFSLAWPPLCDGVIIKIPHVVDVLLHRPDLAPHFFLLSWLKLCLIVSLDQLRLA